MTKPELKALHDGLAVDIHVIVQGHTTIPKCYPDDMGAECEACCPVSYGAWIARGLRTVFEVEQRFAQIVNDATKMMAGNYHVSEFLYWFDHEDRKDVVKALLAEVKLSLNWHH